MTVSELIDRLRAFPPGTPVLVRGGGVSEMFPDPAVAVNRVRVAELAAPPAGTPPRWRAGDLTEYPAAYPPAAVAREFDAVIFEVQ